MSAPDRWQKAISAQPSDWPVLTGHEGETLGEIAFPLGGIGTSIVCLGGRASDATLSLFNQPPRA